MTDKEVRKLSRRDLIELLYLMKKEETSLKKQVNELSEKLSERKQKIEKAGTLAEAMVSVYGVMEASQKAADQYLAEIQNTYSNTEKSCSEMLEKTKKECIRREEEATLQINAKWKEFEQKVDSYLKTHKEFEALRGGFEEKQ